MESIYLDLSKSFNKLDIGMVCHKTLGITGKLGKLFDHFLTNRKRFILVNGAKCGVPQGIVLFLCQPDDF